MRTAWLLGLLLLSGCAEPEPPSPSVPLQQLTGLLLDEAVRPVPDVQISVQGQPHNTTSDADGRFTLDGLPAAQPLVLVFEAQGFRSTTRGVTLAPDAAYRLNVTLEAVPLPEPSHSTEKLAGFLACRAAVTVGGEPIQSSCPGDDVRRWDLQVDAIQAMVIEVVWDGDPLQVVVETVGYGELDAELGHDAGASPLRVEIDADEAARFYAAGGLMRVAVDAGPTLDGGEASAGAAAQQEFEVLLTSFYHQDIPEGFTVT